MTDYRLQTTDHRQLYKKIFDNRYLTFILLLGYYSVCYLGINYINETRDAFTTLALPGEANLPFWPIFIFVYLIEYIGITILVFILKEDEWKDVAKAFFILSTIHFIVFLAYPVKMIWRPEMVGTGITALSIKFIYWLDKPYNCFPSLHVALPLFVAIIVKRLRWIYGAIALSTAFAVVVVKQHYIADIIGAVITSGLAVYITKRFWASPVAQSKFNATKANNID